MNMGRSIKTVGAALAACVSLAACGGGAGGADPPSALDPANMVPSSSVVYISANVRPQGSVATNLVEAIDAIAGKGAADRLRDQITASHSFKWNQLKKWVGQRVGIAITTLPTTLTDASVVDQDLAIVVPTNNPSAARAFLAKNIHQPYESWKVVGHYAIFGGQNAVGQALATTAKTSLAAVPQYRSEMAQLGDGELFTAYAPLHQFLQALIPLLKSDPQFPASSLSAAEKQAPPGSSAAFGLAAPRDEFRLDLISQGTPTSSAPLGAAPTNVSSLPASSWLALSLGGSLTQASAVRKLATTLPQEITRLQTLSGATGSVPNGPLRFIEHDLLPALGPIALSVSGTSRATIKAGLVMSPLNRSAGARLVTAVKQLVTGLPISARSDAGRVALTFGYADLQQLLDPSSKLGDNPDFNRALGQLPEGAKADLYLNFEPIAALASLGSNPASPSTMGVLRRLDYLIAGGTHSHFRLVLGMH